MLTTYTDGSFDLLYDNGTKITDFANGTYLHMSSTYNTIYNEDGSFIVYHVNIFFS